MLNNAKQDLLFDFWNCKESNSLSKSYKIALVGSLLAKQDLPNQILVFGIANN